MEVVAIVVKRAISNKWARCNNEFLIWVFIYFCLEIW